MKEMALFMVTLIGTIASLAYAEGPKDYVPHLTPLPLEGKITTSTFVLEQPRCVFNDIINATDEIWLVVGLSKDVPNFDMSKASEVWPYESFKDNSFYKTLNTTTTLYPCLNSSETGNLITVLRVGSDTTCVDDHLATNCNGPLPGPGPYRVMFLAESSNGVIATKWSKPITLRQAKSLDGIDVLPRRRSRGTIIITTILSILYAVLLATFLAVLICKSSNRCDGTRVSNPQDPTIIRYFAHDICDPSVDKS